MPPTSWALHSRLSCGTRSSARTARSRESATRASSGAGLWAVGCSARVILPAYRERLTPRTGPRTCERPRHQVVRGRSFYEPKVKTRSPSRSRDPKAVAGSGTRRPSLEAGPERSTGRSARAAQSLGRRLGKPPPSWRSSSWRWSSWPPFFVAAVFLAAVFFAGAFLAGAFLAGAFFAVFLAGRLRALLGEQLEAALRRDLLDAVAGRRVALVSPSVTYGPKRPSLTTTGCPLTGSAPSSFSGGLAAARPRCLGCA